MSNELEKRDQRLSLHVSRAVKERITETKPRGQSISQYVDSLLHGVLIKPVKPEHERMGEFAQRIQPKPSDAEFKRGKWLAESVEKHGPMVVGKPHHEDNWSPMNG